ncbi:MAG: M23 family metallopeptidase [Pseudomonadota bacterium]
MILESIKKAMSNRFFTVMVIPERHSRVRKWIVPSRAVRWGVALAGLLVLTGVVSSFLALRYFAKRGEFEQALLKNNYLEGQLQLLQNRVSAADTTMVRIQNFEQKLRVLARVDRPESAGGYGPISSEEEQAMLRDETDPGGTLVASLGPKEAPFEYATKVRSLELTIEGLTKRASLQEQSLQELYELLKDQESLLSSTPSIWPAHGWITSSFGYRVSPFTGEKQLHEGIDISAPPGTKVFAPADGVVTNTITEEGYGKVVAINHGYGIVTRFAHNSEIKVKVGQRIHRGEMISTIGNTGRSTGPHVHYEVRVNGIPVNPTRYILN